MSVIIDGTAGITFPSGSGTQAAQSKVLQVVNASFTSAISTTSTSLVTTGYSASITPLFSTSKILVIFSASLGNNTNTGSGLKLAIYRGGTNITSTTGYLLYSQVSGIGLYQTVQVYDSPATTSSTTYTPYYALSGSGTAYMQTNGTSDFPASLTLMEIAA
jgi:hypothetical protein